MKNFRKDKSLIKIAASLCLLAVFLCLSLVGSRGGITVEPTEQSRPIQESENSASDGEDGAAKEQSGQIGEQEADVIYVDISGCVVRPGVYCLPRGSRLFEAIELAGGLTEDADVRSINRAEQLKDEQRILVLSREEYEERQEQAGGSVGVSGGKININRADAAALEQLSGIGPSMAQRILEYRAANGDFQRIEDLMKVSGIGEKTFAKLRDHICVQ